jgi:hypothetical protein
MDDDLRERIQSALERYGYDAVTYAIRQSGKRPELDRELNLLILRWSERSVTLETERVYHLMMTGA